MDFVADTLAHGRTFRVLTMIDEHTRECLAVETDTSLPGLRVIRVLERLAQTRGLPDEIHVDHGPEFVCGKRHRTIGSRDCLDGFRKALTFCKLKTFTLL